jgi:hypothetical protein
MRFDGSSWSVLTGSARNATLYVFESLGGATESQDSRMRAIQGMLPTAAFQP